MDITYIYPLIPGFGPATQSSDGTWGTNQWWVNNVIQLFATYPHGPVTEQCSYDSQTDTYHSETSIETVDWLTTIQLEDEYTDAMLLQDIMDTMGDYSAWADGSAAASFSINGNHTSATVQALKYRFKLPTTEKDITYKVEWDEVTTYPDGTSSSSHMEEEVDGTGDPTVPVYTSEHEVIPLATTGIITAQSAVVSIVPDNGGGAGNGGAGGGGRAVGGCASCARGGSTSLGAAFSVSMGRASLGRSAGSLTFFSNLPSPQLATPALLSYTAPNRGDVEVIPTSGPIMGL